MADTDEPEEEGSGGGGGGSRAAEKHQFDYYSGWSLFGGVLVEMGTVLWLNSSQFQNLFIFNLFCKHFSHSRSLISFVKGKLPSSKYREQKKDNNHMTIQKGSWLCAGPLNRGMA